MKLLVLVALVAAATAAPQFRAQQQPSRQGQDVQLLRYVFDDTEPGYKYAYEQSDGQKKAEQGELRNQGSESESLAVKGFYTWYSPEGIQYTVTYVADENGYQPNVEQGPGTSPAALASILG